MKKYFLNPIEIILIVILVVSIGIPFAFAVENTFETRLVIGPEDTANPTIPTGLTATPVSSSQINLAWNASTDDIGVAGYRIFRDAVIIASTTSLFYQDLGLTASTTYSYNVEAFDSVPKYSGQSATVNATTSEAVVPPVTPTATTTPSTGGSSGSGSIILNISNLVVVPSQNSSVINFSTNQPTQAKVYWGLTGEYELGSIAGLFYGFTHSIHVDGLLPNTRYFYKVEVVNGLGVTKTVTSSFQTQSDFSESVLTNVINFKAVPAENSITLNWTNPYYDEFESVRVVRSDKFFPRDIYDGQTIYEGADESYIDRDVKVGTIYYYSIFAKDTKGNYSSGALAQARIRPAGEIAVTATSTDPFIDISVLKNVHPVIAELVLADFDFIQDGKKILNIGNTLTINGKKNLTVSLNYNKVPEILKTIAMTMVDPDDSSQVFPFLLRVNKDKTAYEAILAPLGKSGDYKLHVIVLDYKNQGLKRLNGTLQAFVLGSVDTLRTSTGKSFNSFWWILVLVIILIVFYFMSHKRKQNQIAILVLIMSIGGVFAGYSFGVNNTYAAINREINYQGKLTNASNVAVADGTYVMEFKLYTQLVGGTAIWTETLTSTNEVQVTSGLFSVMLGSTTPFTGVNFNQTLYLGVNIEGDGEMSPRKIIGAVPAAFVADTLDNLSSEQFLRSDTQNATSSANTFLNILQSGAGKVAEFFGAASQSVMAILSNGNVGIGTTTPYAKLSVVGQTVSEYFTATSTTATSTLPNLALTNLLFGSDYLNDITGSGLTVSNGALTVTGTTVSGAQNMLAGFNSSGALVSTSTPTAAAYLATSTTATSTFAGGLSAASSLYVLQNGNVGIGTATPGTYKLAVAGAGSFTARSLINNILIGEINTNYDIIQAQSSAGIRLSTPGSINFEPGSSEAMRILSTGNVGIGTTAPFTSLSNSSSDITNQAGTGMGLGGIDWRLSTGGHVVGFENIGGGSGLIVKTLNTNSNNIAVFNSGGTDRMVIKNDTGNVGIGTVSPSDILSVVKNSASAGAAQISLQNTNASGDARFMLKNSGTGALAMQVTGSSYGLPSIGTFFTQGGLNSMGFVTDGDVSSGGSGYMYFSTGGYTQTTQERMRITSTGNVGIGTTSPYAKLSVTNTGTDPSFVVEDSTSPDSTPFIVDASGNVGVGTAVPNYTLQVSNSTPKIVVHDTSFSGTSGALHGQFGFGYYADSTVLLGGLKLLRATSATNGYNGYATVLSAITDGGSETDVLYVGGNGNVGIGTTGPVNKLEVGGGTGTVYSAINGANSGATGGAALRIQNGGADIAVLGNASAVNGGAYDSNFRISTTGEVQFSTGSLDTPKMVIQSTGNVGIGTAVPGRLLDISGAGNSAINTSAQLRLTNTTGTSSWESIQFSDGVTYNSFIGATGGLNTASTRLLGFSSNSAVPQMVIDGNGNVGISTSSPSQRFAVVGTSANGSDQFTVDTAAANNNGVYSVFGPYSASVGGDRSAQINITNNSSGNFAKFRTAIISPGTGSLGEFGSAGASSGTFQNTSYMTTLNATDLILATNVVERLRVTSGGNVGIGTTSPAYPLQVAGTLSATTILGGGTPAAGTAGAVYISGNSINGQYSNDADGIMYLNYTGYNAGTTRFRDTQISNGKAGNILFAQGSTGNVGIGTTSPYAKLSVEGSSALGNSALAGYFTATTTTASTFPYASTTALSATALCLSSDCRTSWASVGSAYPFSLTGNATSTLTQFNGGLTSYASTTIGNGTQIGGLTISGGATTTGNAYFAGNVGIGTVSPTEKLHVVGNMLIDTTAQQSIMNSSGGYLTFGQNAASNRFLKVGGFSDGITFDQSINFSGNYFIGGGSANSITFNSSSGPNDVPAQAFTASQGSDPNNPVFRFWDNSTYAGHRVFGVGGGTTYTEYMTIKNDGNVGIGTTSPGQKLSVAGDILGNNIIGSYFTATSTTATSTFAGGISGPNSFTVQSSSGNVGIGTASPAFALDVYGDSAKIGGVTNNGKLRLGKNDSYYGYMDYSSSGNTTLTFGSTYNSDLNKMVFKMKESVDALTILGSGNVGIGTTGPNWKLDVAESASGESAKFAGRVGIGTDPYTSNDNYQLNVGTGILFQGVLFGQTVDFIANSSGFGGNSGDAKILAGAAEKVRITTTGNVGIGTTSPYAKLSVEGSSALGNSALAGYFTATSTTLASVFPNASTTNLTITGKLYDSTSSAGTNGMVLQTTGSVTNWVATSSLGFLSSSSIGSGTTGQFPYYAGSGTTLTATSSLFLASSGNVGVGTTDPGSYKLNVNGAVDLGTGANYHATISNGVFSASSNGGTNGRAQIGLSGSAGYVILKNSSDVTQVSLLSNGDSYILGNVGIGTVSPIYKLDVNGALAFSTSFSGTPPALGTAAVSNEILGIDGNTTADAGFLRLAAGGGTTIGEKAAIDILGYSGTAGNRSQIRFLTGGTQVAVIDRSGNVGIGTTTPQNLLSLQKLTAGTNNLISLEYGLSNNDGAGITWTTAGGIPVGSITNSRFTSGGYKMAFNNWDGNANSEILTLRNYTSNVNYVGIGTTSPFAKLAVTGSSVGTGIIMQLADSDNTPRVTVLNGGNVGIGTADPLVPLQIGAAGSDTMPSNTSLWVGNRIMLGRNGGGDIRNSYFIDPTTSNLTLGNRNNSNEYPAIYIPFTDSAKVGINGAPGSATLYVNGNVGIGTTSPYAKLSVTNTGTGPSFVVEDSTSPDTTPFMIDADGNVGVGTATPRSGYKLDVAGSVTFSGTSLYGTGASMAVYYDGDFGLFSSGGANQVTVQRSTGNVGIGTTSPYAKLSVVGEVVGEKFTATSTTATSTFAGGISGPNSFTVQSSSGNVGIGTTGPTSALHVAGTLTVQGSGVNAATIYSGYGFANGELILKAANMTQPVVISPNGGMTIGGMSTNPPANGLNIQGNVGIGTTSPYAKLSVVGQTVSEYFTATSTTATSTLPNLALTNLLFGSDYLNDITGSGLTVSNGALTVTGTTVSGASNMLAGFNSSGSLVSTSTPTAAAYLATSTTATSTFAGGLSAASSLYVLQNGNVGVGTAGPTQALDLNTGNLITSGKVWVGTTALSYDIEARKLVQGDVGIKAYNTRNDTAAAGAVIVSASAADLFVRTFAPAYTTNGAYVADGSVIDATSGASGGLSISASDSAGIIRMYTGGSSDSNERLRITSAGNVGIGTTTPATSLDVNGIITGRSSPQFFSSESGQVDRRLTFNVTSADLPKIYNYDDGAGTFHSIQFGGSTSVTGLVVEGTGNVGIGTTTPNALLSLYNPANGTGNIIGFAGPSGTGGGIGVANNALYFNGPNTNTVFRLANGKIRMGDGGSNLGYIELAGGSISNQGNGGGLTFDNSNNAYFSANASTTQIGSTGSAYFATASGNVGIGTVAPAADLHVNQRVGSYADATILAQAPIYPGIWMKSDNANSDNRNWAFIPNFTSYGQLDLRNSDAAGGNPGSAGTSRLVINNAGNVGIGTASPGSLLDVSKSASGLGGEVVIRNPRDTSPYTDYAALSFNLTSTASTYQKGGILYVGDGTSYGHGDMYFVQNSGTTAANASTADAKMVIKNNGNVGIGTTGPGTKLHVKGITTIEAGGADATFAEVLRLSRTSFPDTYYHSIYTNHASGVANNSIDFRVNYGETVQRSVLTLLGSGNVGIGTVSPGTALSVSQSASGINVGSFTNTHASGYSSIQFNDNTAALKVGFGYGNASVGNAVLASRGYLWTNTGVDLAIDAGGLATPPIFINGTTGNVGIGTAGPVNKLEVGGGTGTVYSAINGANSGATGGAALRIQNGGADIAVLGNASAVNGGAYDSNFRISATGEVQFSTGSLDTPKMVIQSTGNVGIGTTSPVSKLSVLGESAFAGGASVGIGYAGTVAPTGGLIIQGNVGIGTTNPGAKLSIAAGASGSSVEQIRFNRNSDDVRYNSIYSNASNGTNDATISFLLHDKVTTTSQATVMTLVGTGNVGIGTTTPIHLLEVGNGQSTPIQVGYNGAYINPNSSTAQMSVSNNLGDQGGVFAISGGVYMGSWSNDPLYIRTSNTTRMTLDTSGNVGIGTTTPGYKLEVQGTNDQYTRLNTSTAGANVGLILNNWGDANNSWAIARHDAGNLNIYRSDGVYPVGTLTTPFTISTADNVGIGSTTPYAKLSVTNTGTGPSFVVEDSTSPDSTPFIVDASGNVGIGTASPASKLHVSGLSTLGTGLSDLQWLPAVGNSAVQVTSNTAQAVNSGSTLSLGGRYRTSGTDLIAWGSIGGLKENSTDNNGDGFLSFYTANHSAGASAERMRITSTGNVGIGTTSPFAKLSVVGQTVSEYFTATSTTATSTLPNLALTNLLFGSDYLNDITGSGLTVSNGALTVTGTTISGASNMLAGFNSSGSLVSTSTPTAAAYLATSTTATSTFAGGLVAGNGSLNVLQNGNVGVGTAAPGAKLDVVGSGVGNSGIRSDGIRSLISDVNNQSVAGYFSTAGQNASFSLVTGQGPINFGSLGTSNLTLNGLASFASVHSATAGNLFIGDNTSGFIAGNGGDIVFGGDDRAQGSVFATFANVRGIKENGSYLNSLGALVFGTQSNSGAAQGLSTVTEKMRITSGGNVGIGTTSPYAKLSVEGSSALGNSALAGYFIATTTTVSTFAGPITTSGTTGGYRIDNNLILQASSTNFSTLVGQSAGAALLSDGLYSTALGYEALKVATSSDANTAVGFQALYSNTTGTLNNAFGSYSLRANTTGTENTAVGSETLYSNTTGTGNSAFNYRSLFSNTTGSSNTAYGYRSMQSNTTGGSNTAVGYYSLYSNTTGSNNAVNGANSLYYNTTGIGNTSNGVYSLYSNTTGAYNTAGGYASLYYNTSATSSVAIGYNAGSGTANYNNQGGVYVGYQAGNSVATGSDYNTFVGYQSGYTNNTGTQNTAIGTNTLRSNTSGYRNVTLGYQAGYGINTGSTNIMIGSSNIAASYNQVTSGSNNISIGNDVAIADATASNQLNIGNLIYGTGLSGTGATLSTGNIGIGTTSPAYKLDVYNGGLTGTALRVTGFPNGTLNDVGIDMSLRNQVTATYARFSVKATESSTGIETGSLIFSTVNSGTLAEKMRITNNGDVGIGTTSPYAKLSVEGSSALGNSALAGYFIATTTTVSTFAGPITTSGTTGGYRIDNNLILQASSTNYSTLVGRSAGAGLLSDGLYNTALGYEALKTVTSSDSNTAVGYRSLYSNTTGYSNTANGMQSLYFNTTGVNNTANGYASLYSNTTGASNTANGVVSLYYNTSATSSTAFGYSAGQGTANYNNQGGVYVGYQAGFSAGTGSDYNTFLGYNSGYGVTTGARNTLIGNSTIAASYNQVTTGSNNIAIGNDVAVASATASNQLNIGNLIYGTGLSGTGATLSTGNIGIGTTSPYAKLSVEGSSALGNSALAGYFIATSTTATSTFAGGVILPAAGMTNIFASPGSIALGSNITATGVFASGSGSIAMGIPGIGGTIQASGNGSIAGGGGGLSLASGQGSIAWGNVTSSALRTVSFGNGFTNNISDSFMVGYGSTVPALTVVGSKVGVGTTSPYAKLSVVGQVVGEYFTATSTTIASTFPYASTTALSATSLCISADCRTSWPTGGGASYDWLQQTNTFSVNSLTPTTTLPIWIKSTATSTFAGGIESWAKIGAPYFNATSTTATSTFAGGLNVHSGALVVDYSSNNVGIGTAAPGSLLELSAANAILTINGSSNPYLQIKNGATTYGYFGKGSSVVTGGPSTGVGITAIGDLAFGTGSGLTEQMRITSTGNVGIGTTTPAAKLQVTNGSSSVTPYVGSDMVIESDSSTYVNILSPDANFSSVLFGGPTQTFGGEIMYTGKSYSGVIPAGSLSFGTNGNSGRILITSSGNVGIGTTSPYAKLSVDGTFALNAGATTNAMVLKYGTAGTASLITDVDNNNINLKLNKGSTAATAQIQFLTNSVNKWYTGVADTDSAGGGDEFYVGTGDGGSSAALWIEQNGNVGIGTTSPYAKLSVAGQTVSEYFTATSTTRASIFPNASTTNLTVAGLFFDSLNSAGLNGYVFQSTGSAAKWVATSTLGITAGGSSLFTDAGTFTYLTATSDDVVFGAATTANAPFWWDVSATTTYIGNGGAGDSVIQLGDDNNAWTLGYDDTDKAFRIASSTTLGSSDVFTILKTGGMVGIGTTTPWRTLSVSGTMALSSSLSVATVGNYLCINQTTYEVTSGTTCSASSRRFKDNIIPISYGLDTVMRLNPVSFTYKPEVDPNGDTRLGFIAEEVQVLLPELVALDKNGLPESVDYSKLVSVLTKAIQELNLKVDTFTTGTTTTSLAGGNTFMTNIWNFVSGELSSLGVLVSDGMVSMKALAVETLKVGSKEKPSGITLYDEDTGNPYCLKIKNGTTQTTAGECGTATTPTIAVQQSINTNTTTVTTATNSTPVTISPVVTTIATTTSTSTPTIVITTDATTTPIVTIPVVATTTTVTTTTTPPADNGGQITTSSPTPEPTTTVVSDTIPTPDLAPVTPPADAPITSSVSDPTPSPDPVVVTTSTETLTTTP